MSELLKILNVILLATVKFFWTTPYALLLDFTAFETFCMIMVGGVVGVTFFFYFGALIRFEWQQHHKTIEKYIPVVLNAHLEKSILDSKIFQSKRLRRLIGMRERFGLWGIAILTPVVLSIPLGSILMSKFFSKHKYPLGKLYLCLLFWGIVSVGVFYFLPMLKGV